MSLFPKCQIRVYIVSQTDVILFLTVVHNLVSFVFIPQESHIFKGNTVYLFGEPVFVWNSPNIFGVHAP